MSPRRIWNGLVIALLRPYTRRELPGWGRLYRLLVGTHESDKSWRGSPPRWMRGKLHGYEMLLDISGWSNRHTFFLGRFYDLKTQTVLRTVLKPGDTFVDIGANEGQMSLLAASLVGESGRVHAFEPNPVPRSRLETAIERNGITTITIHAMGLAERDGELPLNVPKINTGEGSFGESAYAEEDVDRVICPIRRGDDVLANVTPRLVKIDVEGFEVRALQGLSQLIARARPAIVSEVIAGHLARAGSSVQELFALMEGAGYRGYRLSIGRSGIKHRLRLKEARPAAGFAADVLWLQKDDPARQKLFDGAD